MVQEPFLGRKVEAQAGALQVRRLALFYHATIEIKRKVLCDGVCAAQLELDHTITWFGLLHTDRFERAERQILLEARVLLQLELGIE
jgi:hypothetical protein